jgi:hypothetical protein
MQEWVSTSVHSSTSRRGPPRTTSSSVPPQLRRTYYAERTARGFPFPRDFRHTGEFAPAASQAHSFPAQPTRLLTPNTYIRPISNTYIRLTRFTHSQLTAMSRTGVVSWRRHAALSMAQKALWRLGRDQQRRCRHRVDIGTRSNREQLPGRCCPRPFRIGH